MDGAPRPYLPSGRKPRRDDELETTIERVDRDGSVLARWGDYRVRLRSGVPGRRVRAQVTRRRKHRLDARVLEVLSPGPDEVTPRCPHFGPCGGCRHQDLRYGAQLAELRRIVQETLAPLGPGEVAPVLGAEQPWGYRNKMELTFSPRRWKEEGEPEPSTDGFALGLHVPGRHRKVIDLQRCEIQFPEANGIMTTARRLALEAGLPPWDPVEHTGSLRHLVLRKGFNTGEIMVNLVTSELFADRVDPLAGALLEAHPEITTLVHNVTTRRAVVATGERERVLHGPGVIHESLRGMRFAVSSESFFQTNTAQAERLLDVVLDQAGLGADEVVYDLYCGVGTLSLHLAGAAREVWGFELVPDAVADARRNAEVNGVSRCRFETGDLAEVMRPERRTELGAPPPDVVVADPPRAGMHKRVVRALGELAPRRVVYVSCNVESAARDLAPLCDGGYRIAEVQPVDLFPHTPHLEVVLRLERG